MTSAVEAEEILRIVTGRVAVKHTPDREVEAPGMPDGAFTGTVGLESQTGEFEVERMGGFQR